MTRKKPKGPLYILNVKCSLQQRRSEGSAGGGCGPHQAALARGRQIGENCKRNSREISLARKVVLQNWLPKFSNLIV